jgi:hypothetical protein
LPEGFCFVTTHTLCTSLNGVYGGDGVTCASANCPQPTGACCLPDHTCSVLTHRDCAAQHGVYHGDNLACSAVNCSAFDAADWNHDGKINILDAAAFMRDFAAGHADLNGDGVTDVRDMLAFVNDLANGARAANK